MALSSCATSGYSTPPFCLRNGMISSLSKYQVRNLRINHRIGLTLLTETGFRARNTPSNLRVFCLRDTTAAVVTGKSWEKLVLNSDTPVLVEFYASWCGPCQMVHRVIDEIAMNYAGRLKCFVLNTDSDLQVAEDYDIKAVPVVLLFKKGVKLESVIGTMPKEFYIAAIERVLAS